MTRRKVHESAAITAACGIPESVVARPCDPLSLCKKQRFSVHAGRDFRRRDASSPEPLRQTNWHGIYAPRRKHYGSCGSAARGGSLSGGTQPDTEVRFPRGDFRQIDATGAGFVVRTLFQPSENHYRTRAEGFRRLAGHGGKQLCRYDAGPLPPNAGTISKRWRLPASVSLSNQGRSFETADVAPLDPPREGRLQRTSRDCVSPQAGC